MSPLKEFTDPARRISLSTLFQSRGPLTTKPSVSNHDEGTNTMAPPEDLRLWVGSDRVSTSAGQHVLSPGGDEGVDDLAHGCGYAFFSLWFGIWLKCSIKYLKQLLQELCVLFIGHWVLTSPLNLFQTFNHFSCWKTCFFLRVVFVILFWHSLPSRSSCQVCLHFTRGGHFWTFNGVACFVTVIQQCSLSVLSLYYIPVQIFAGCYCPAS